ncbi:MAG: hypothetical protein EOP04_01275 [Proteobacteria bacterium]|nr:MAG: hypothetical protein EOP04_01275 [Pseudomonadota bacterium]
MRDNIDPNMIQMSLHFLYIGKYHISLHGKRRSIELLQNLLAHKDGIYHADLRECMFGRTSKNKRILRTQDCTLRKLITRTRTMLTSALAQTEWTDGVQWLVYRDRDESWKLFHLPT